MIVMQQYAAEHQRAEALQQKKQKNFQQSGDLLKAVTARIAPSRA